MLACHNHYITIETFGIFYSPISVRAGVSACMSAQTCANFLQAYI